MTTLQEIEKALKDVTPNDKHEQLLVLSQLILALLHKPEDTSSIQSQITSDVQMRALVSSLLGKNIQLGEAVISFGTGLQANDITFGDVALGSVVKINIYSNSQEKLNTDKKIPVNSQGSLANFELLEAIWLQVVQAFNEGDMRTADLLLFKIGKINPNYRGISKYISEAQRAAMLQSFYIGLCEKDDQQWLDVRRGMGFLEYWCPGYPDPNGLKEWVKKQEARTERYEIALQKGRKGLWNEAINDLRELLDQFPGNEECEELLRKIIKKRESEIYLQNKRKEAEYRQQEIRYQETEIQHFEKYHKEYDRQQEKGDENATIVGIIAILLIVALIGFFATYYGT